MKKTLLTSPTCGPCQVLKNKLALHPNLNYDTKDFSIDADKEFFHQHNIRSVPRLVIEDGQSVTIIQGSEDIIANLLSGK